MDKQRRTPQATRPVFMIIQENQWKFCIENITFDFYSGFSIEQKQRSIKSFHSELSSILSKKYKTDIYPLEVSTKSLEPLGVSLSAFNLVFPRLFEGESSATIEMVFQSSKVFENGDQYIDLLYGDSRSAKKDPRLRNSGELLEFRLFEKSYPLEPKTIFYDWLYAQAFLRTIETKDIRIKKFNAFTDIEFNPKVSINCQAKSLAISLIMAHREIGYSDIKTFEDFTKVYNLIVDSSSEILDIEQKNNDQYFLF